MNLESRFGRPTFTIDLYESRFDRPTFTIDLGWRDFLTRLQADTISDVQLIVCTIQGHFQVLKSKRLLVFDFYFLSVNEL